MSIRCDDVVSFENYKGVCWFDSMITSLLLNDSIGKMIRDHYENNGSYTNKMKPFIKNKKTYENFEAIIDYIGQLLNLVDAFKYGPSSSLDDRTRFPLCMRMGMRLTELLQNVHYLDDSHFANTKKLFKVLEEYHDIHTDLKHLADTAIGNSPQLLLSIPAMFNIPFYYRVAEYNSIKNNIKFDYTGKDLLIVRYKLANPYEYDFKYHCPLKYEHFTLNIVSYGKYKHAISAFVCGRCWYLYDNNSKKPIVKIGCHTFNDLLIKLTEHMNNKYKKDKPDDFGSYTLIYVNNDKMVVTSINR